MPLRPKRTRGRSCHWPCSPSSCGDGATSAAAAVLSTAFLIPSPPTPTGALKPRMRYAWGFRFPPTNHRLVQCQHEGLQCLDTTACDVATRYYWHSPLLKCRGVEQSMKNSDYNSSLWSSPPLDAAVLNSVMRTGLLKLLQDDGWTRFRPIARYPNPSRITRSMPKSRQPTFGHCPTSGFLAPPPRQ